MNVRVNLNYPIFDGAEIVFKAPCDASKVTGLIVYYPGDTGVVSSVFTFVDAHTNDLGHIDELFAAGAVVKVILDTDTGMAFVQNAATNAYLENRFANIGGGGGSADLSNYYTKPEVDDKIGDISTALDRIIALQEELIGGPTENTFVIMLTEVYSEDQDLWWCKLSCTKDELYAALNAGTKVVVNTDSESNVNATFTKTASGGWDIRIVTSNFGYGNDDIYDSEGEMVI